VIARPHHLSGAGSQAQQRQPIGDRLIQDTSRLNWSMAGGVKSGRTAHAPQCHHLGRVARRRWQAGQLSAPYTVTPSR